MIIKKFKITKDDYYKWNEITGARFESPIYFLPEVTYMKGKGKRVYIFWIGWLKWMWNIKIYL